MITVELFGTARYLARVPEVEIEARAGLTGRDIVAHLAERLPMLVGPVIADDHHHLVGSFVFNIDGRDFIRDLDSRVPDGSRLLLLFNVAGG